MTMEGTQYRCGVCGEVKSTADKMRGHMAAMMETNDKIGGDHPHWDELEVSHHDLSAWRESVPGVEDFC